MKYKEISATVAQKISTAQYENRTYCLSMTATIEEEDDPQIIKNHLVKKLEQFIDYEIKKFKEGEKENNNYSGQKEKDSQKN